MNLQKEFVDELKQICSENDLLLYFHEGSMFVSNYT